MSGDAVLWAVIVVSGLLTYALRASFVLPAGLSELPDGFERALAFVPAAVLAGLVLPSLLLREGALALSAANEKLLAGVVAFAVAWVSEDTIATIAAGMAAFWALRFLV
jgi:branched-subunit amino acid transport protein